MLPESKDYLTKDGYSDRAAGLIMMGCFIGGFFGIQAVSRLVHQFMPSHVVDCSTTDDDADSHHHDDQRKHSRPGRSRRRVSRKRSAPAPNGGISKITEIGNGVAAESTPLLVNGGPRTDDIAERSISPQSGAPGYHTLSTDPAAVENRRPSMSQVQKRVLSFVRDTKPDCDETGTCYGFTDPCVLEPCIHFSNPIPYSARHGRVLRTATTPAHRHSGPVIHGHDNTGEAPPISPRFHASRTPSREPLSPPDEETEVEDAGETESGCQDDSNSTGMPEWDAESQQHHHHVPANAFLSIGLQTSIAIALHKFPEGFITYATNHANPTLGFNVFMALFVHNISEGFAMCLPLYMALGSRWRATLWSAVLGGLSQPLGAGVAVLWFKLARRTNMSPSSAVYACLFAITAGIMVSVGLQLFVEALGLNHNRNLCIGFGFLGMAILGLSNALFGGH